MASTSFLSAALARRAAPQLLALTPAALRTASRLPAASLARSASSFIARAKASGPEGLLGNFTSAGTFDRCLEEAELACTSVADGRVECAFTVTHETANNFGTLHGGFTATLVDVVGTMALLSRDAGRPGVSIEMSQTFCAAAKVGESKKLAPRTTTEVPPALGPKRGTIDETRGRAKYSNVRSSSKASPAFFPTPMPTPKSTKPTAPLGDRQINRALASSVASTLFSPK